MTVHQTLTDADIDRIARGLVARDLPKDEWTHAAHFAATLWLLRHEPDGLPTRMPGLIRAYNESVGGVNSDTEGYHETITQASLRAAADQLGGHPAGTPLSVVLAQLLAGPLGGSSWILEHWSRERLFSVQARREWVEPDLLPLPF